MWIRRSSVQFRSAVPNFSRAFDPLPLQTNIPLFPSSNRAKVGACWPSPPFRTGFTNPPQIIRTRSGIGFVLLCRRSHQTEYRGCFLSFGACLQNRGICMPEQIALIANPKSPAQYNKSFSGDRRKASEEEHNFRPQARERQTINSRKP